MKFKQSLAQFAGMVSLTVVAMGTANAGSLTFNSGITGSTQVSGPSFFFQHPGNSSGNAFVITGNQVPSIYDTLSGTHWVTAFVDRHGVAASAASLADYYFTTSFNLAGPFVISGSILADNTLDAILLDGKSLSFTGGPGDGDNYSFGSFQLPAYLFSGSGTGSQHTLTLKVDNNLNLLYNPASADFTFTATTVPEPSAAGALGMGSLGLGIFGLLRRRQSVCRQA